MPIAPCVVLFTQGEGDRRSLFLAPGKRPTMPITAIYKPFLLNSG
ncbi:hypothetical protein [Nostoc sp.]